MFSPRGSFQISSEDFHDSNVPKMSFFFICKINFIKFEIYSLLFLSVKENLMKYPLVIFLLFFSFEIPVALLKKICPREAA